MLMQNIGIVFSPRLESATLLRSFWSYGSVRLILPFQTDRSLDTLVLPDGIGASVYLSGFSHNTKWALGVDSCSTVDLFVKETLPYYIEKQIPIIGYGDGAATLYSVIGGKIANVSGELKMIYDRDIKADCKTDEDKLFVTSFNYNNLIYGVESLIQVRDVLKIQSKLIAEDISRIEEKPKLPSIFNFPRKPK
jgi:hypothetical protein